MYIYYYFFFSRFLYDSLRLAWSTYLLSSFVASVVCRPFSRSFLDPDSVDVFSLRGNTTGNNFVENRDLLYVLFTQRVKVATNKRTKFSIQTFYSSAATVFKSDKVYFWLLLDEIDEIVPFFPCCFSQMRIDRRLLLRYSRISTTVAIRSSRSGRARITATIVSFCFFIVVVGCFQNLDEQLWRSFWTRWI